MQKNLGGFSAPTNLLGFGSGAQDKLPKNYTTQMTYMSTFKDKSVIMTGATGGIGSKVAKRLIKAGKSSQVFLNASRC